MSRWISWVRPDGLPSFTSRPIRSGDEPGSIEYSAVTQPLPLPRIQRGTSSSMEAVHSTRVPPKVTSTDPPAASVKSRSNVMGRSSSGWRPSWRMAGLLVREGGDPESHTAVRPRGNPAGTGPTSRLRRRPARARAGAGRAPGTSHVARGQEAVLRRATRAPPGHGGQLAAEVAVEHRAHRERGLVGRADTSTTSRPITSANVRARYG